MGIRSPVHSFTPCFVICNTWPGWLAVLPSFGFQCTHLVQPIRCVVVINAPPPPWLPALAVTSSLPPLRVVVVPIWVHARLQPVGTVLPHF